MHSITLIGFTSLFSSNGKLDEYSETFIKKNAYYYMRDVEYDDKDFGLITQYYIINGEILINRQFKKNKKPSHTVVLRMKPTTNEVEELFFENVNIDINPKKLNRLYSNTNLTRIINNTIKISNNKLLIEQTTKKISENTSKTLNVYFTGYPDLQINSYWNIYKLFMGKDI